VTPLAQSILRAIAETKRTGLRISFIADIAGDDGLAALTVLIDEGLVEGVPGHATWARVTQKGMEAA